ncbi:hypothetical protein M514_02851, partial [Trichuris suis]
MFSGTEEHLCNFWRTDERISRKLLFAKELLTGTERVTFLVVEELFKEKNILLTNIMTVSADGTPWIPGKYRVFLAHLKEVVPSVLSVHCVIHSQHLVTKHPNDRLSCSVLFVIEAVNKIKNHLREVNDDDFNRLLLEGETRWLSKCASSSRFYSLFDRALEFLGDDNATLRDNQKKF